MVLLDETTILMVGAAVAVLAYAVTKDREESFSIRHQIRKAAPHKKRHLYDTAKRGRVQVVSHQGVGELTGVGSENLPVQMARGHTLSHLVTPGSHITRPVVSPRASKYGSVPNLPPPLNGIGLHATVTAQRLPPMSVMFAMKQQPTSGFDPRLIG